MYHLYVNNRVLVPQVLLFQCCNKTLVLCCVAGAKNGFNMTLQTISDKISTIATAMSIFSVGGMLVDLFVYIYLILLFANKSITGQSVSKQPVKLKRICGIKRDCESN